MAEGRQRHSWAHTSSLLALIANANRDPKKHRPYKPRDFDPFAGKNKGGIPIIKENISVLRDFFEGEKR